MDIPDLEELEWLESSALDDQFDDDFELDVEPPSPPSPPSSSKPLQRPTLSLPPKPSPFKPQPQTSPTPKKRAGSDLLNLISLDVNDNPFLGKSGKRSRNGEGEARSENFTLPECPDVGSMESGDAEKNNEGSDDDEEWLRRSSPRDTVEEMEVVEDVTQERILSRFATEIDGDCVPITGLDGERVYAKICSSVEMDDEGRNDKLSFRRDHEGEAITFDVFVNLINCFIRNNFFDVLPRHSGLSLIIETGRYCRTIIVAFLVLPVNVSF